MNYVGKITIDKNQRKWTFGKGLFLIVHNHYQGSISQTIVGYVQFSTYTQEENNKFIGVKDLSTLNDTTRIFYNPITDVMYANDNGTYHLDVFFIAKY